MANVKISQLPTSSTPLTGAELVPIVQSGTTKQTTVDDFANETVKISTAFLQAGTNAQARTPQSKLRESVSVKDFGALGNNSADDTVAIQRAIDAVYSSGGGTVYLPAGTYVLTACLIMRTNVNIRGDGREATTIRTQNYGSGATFNVGGISSALLYGNDVSNILIEDLGLKGVSINGAASSGISFTRTNAANTAHIIVRNVFVNEHAGSGISISVPILTSFQNVKIRYCAGNGFSLYGGGSYGGTSVGFYECYVVTTTQAAFNLDTMVYCTLVSCAAEVSGIGYNFINSSAIALVGCGAESNIYRSATYPGLSYKTNNSTVAVYSCFSMNSAVANAAYTAGQSYNNIFAGHFNGNFNLHNCRIMTQNTNTSTYDNRFIGLLLQNIPTSTTPSGLTGTYTSGTVWSNSGVLNIV